MITSTRRSFFGALAATGFVVGVGACRADAAPLGAAAAPRQALQDEPTGPFALPPLPYAYDALVPDIDMLTMELHHDKHHQTYVTNLNKAVADQPNLQAMTAEELITSLASVPEAIRSAIRNHGGGHVNHSMFWELMTPGGSPPSGNLLAAINRDFGSLDEMKTAVIEAGKKQFGSGWAWVVVNDGSLSILSTPNQDNPLMDGKGFPILGIDVWEHAYYLTYQNKRDVYLTNWWNVLNWDVVASRFAAGSI